MSKTLVSLPALFVFFLAATVQAHPVPQKNHDRTLVVRLSGDAKTGQVEVLIDYRLEVAEQTVLGDDLAPFLGQIDGARFREKPESIYGEFTRLYAPIFADNLVVRLDRKLLKVECIHREHRLRDETGQVLGHLRCDFRFRVVLPGPFDRPRRLELHEGNYQVPDPDEGKVDLSVVVDPSFKVMVKIEPDAELKKRPATQRRPGDEDRLRAVEVTFMRVPTASAPPAAVAPLLPPTAAAPPREPSPSDDGLLRLFMDREGGFVWLLLVAAGLGAVHALTPGHGKTLVAAYLVGERGTTLHAVVLGIVTTLTHTAVVFVFAIVLASVSLEARATVAEGLQLLMGIIIAGLGVWLLLRRLTGQADHFHLGGHGHHHHHGHVHPHHDHDQADHDHDAHGNVVPRPSGKQPVGWWGVITLGISGGIVPCWDAVVILGVAVAMDQLPLAVPMLLAFSAGLAGVLVLIGILTVHVGGFLTSRWGEGRIVRALPIVSAAVIAVMGIALSYNAVQGQSTHGVPPRAAASAP
jgi:nickel/cobalt transporter (NicO) family protein